MFASTDCWCSWCQIGLVSLHFQFFKTQKKILRTPNGPAPPRPKKDTSVRQQHFFSPFFASLISRRSPAITVTRRMNMTMIATRRVASAAVRRYSVPCVVGKSSSLVNVKRSYGSYSQHKPLLMPIRIIDVSTHTLLYPFLIFCVEPNHFSPHIHYSIIII